MATIAELERALVNADAAGDADAARKLAAALVRARERNVGQIPTTADPRNEQASVSTRKLEEPSLLDKAKGVGEAALTTVTGATGGLAGLIGGAAKGAIDNIAGDGGATQEQMGEHFRSSAAAGAQALTYAPRTELGRAYAEEVVQMFQKLAPPLAGLGGMTQAVGAGARASQPVIQENAAAMAAAAREAAATARARIPGMAPEAAAQPAVGGSVGAAGLTAPEARAARARELPVPIELTQGQRTRDFVKQRFENETAKDAEAGAPIRQRMAQQRQQLIQNVDAFLDETGAQATELRSVGDAVDKALRARAARDKVKIRSLYKEAEKAGELEAPFTPTDVIKMINDAAPESEVATVLNGARKKAIALGLAKEENGQLVAQPVSLKIGELFRRSVNEMTDSSNPTNTMWAGRIKEAYDAQTETLGGQMYRSARSARAQYARDYELNGLTRSLIGKKRGTEDRAVALEDVFRRSIADPSASLDDVRHVRKLLQTQGEEGQQAWRELQGATVRHMRDKALENVARDDMGTPVFSAAKFDRELKALDANGKLEFVFGKKGAEQMRILADVARDVMVPVQGTVNTSNTASVLAASFDLMTTAGTGVPVPVATALRMLSTRIKDSRLRARVAETLRSDE